MSSEDKERDRYLNVRLPEETYNSIESKISPFYRSPTISHTVRLMIEDVVDMIEKGQMQRMTLQSIHEPQDPEVVEVSE